MPPTATRKKFTCDVPGCEWGPIGGPASYDLPQHLGLHKRHKHGVTGASRAPSKKAVAKAAKAVATPVAATVTAPPVRRGRPPKRTGPMHRHAELSAEEVCAVVLREISPNGSIPIEAIGAYNEWVAQTGAFIVYLLG